MDASHHGDVAMTPVDAFRNVSGYKQKNIFFTVVCLLQGIKGGCLLFLQR